MKKSSIIQIVIFVGIIQLTLSLIQDSQRPALAQNHNPQPPTEPVKLVFIHHSCGENWLMDGNGDLGRTLGENNYFASDTNYGWGPDSIGDATDYFNWFDWFLGSESPRYLEALYTESGQNSDYNRPLSDPGGENQIIMFKSCFPNSDLAGNPEDSPEDGEWFTVSHAKYIYNQLLSYFSTRPDKLYIAITPPPLLDPTNAENAREFSRWLVEDWLIENNYKLNNVAVWDFHNVLTHPDNHHRYHNGTIEYIIQNGNGTLSFDSDGDEHPNNLGNQKSTAEFIPMLNIFYNRWVATISPEIQPIDIEPTIQEEIKETPEVEIASTPVPLVILETNVIDDFEGDLPLGTNGWEAFSDYSTNSFLTCELNQIRAHDSNSSLQIEYQVEPGGWATCPLFYDNPPDFSEYRGISFDYQASVEGLSFDVNAYTGTPDSRSTYLYSIVSNEDSISGWEHIEITWEQIVRAEWEENSGTSINPAEINGFAFGFNAETESSTKGTIWIDNLNLITKERMKSEEIEGEPDSTGESRQICPVSIPMVSIILLTIVFGRLQYKRKSLDY